MLNQFNSNKFFVIIGTGAILLLQGCGEKIDARQSETINGLFYKIKADEPFTGTITNYRQHSVGQLSIGSCELPIKKGLPDGTITCTSDGGVKVGEAEVKNGLKNGREKKWDLTTGKLMLDMGWKDDRKDGLEEKFNPTTGKATSKINWSNGLNDGVHKEWDPTGDVLLTDVTWKNGKATGFQKSERDEYNVKNGLFHGVHRRYDYDGRVRYLALEEHYKDGVLDGLYQEWDEFKKLVLERRYKDGIIQSESKPSDLSNTSDQNTPLEANTISNDGKNSRIEACVDTKILQFRQEHGQDTPINNEVLQEWNYDCTT